MNWNQKLSPLEVSALSMFVMNKRNECEIIKEEYDPTFMNEGLFQTLYRHPRTNEFVFVSRQKGRIMDALHIYPEEIEEFMAFWNDDKLTPYGHIKGNDKSL